MKQLEVIEVTVRHDEESGVWYVLESNIPGLHAEADTVDALRGEVLALIPILINANETPVAGRKSDDHKRVPLELIMQSNESININL